MRSIHTKYRHAFLYSILSLALGTTGCNKAIEVTAPNTSINTDNVYNDDASAAAVLTGLYAKISNLNADLGSGGLTSISLYQGLSADELTLYNLNDTRLPPFYTNNVSSTTSSGNFWASTYPLVFIANAAIEGLGKTSTLNPQVKQQLLGEAKFVRAFCFFYLTNLYGDVPLVTSTDYNDNLLLARTPKAKVYQQIVADLTDAVTRLSSVYLKADALTAYAAGAEQRTRPTKAAAQTFLARVYLYTGDYVNAEAQASAVINNASLYKISPLAAAFKMNSTETIWALQPVRAGTQANSGDGALFILPATGPNTSNYPVYLSNNVVNSFEAGDQRKANWTGNVASGGVTYYYPNKYKIGALSAPTSEYSIPLRLAELYLIRAEARAQQNNISDAQADLNVVRSRAGLGVTTATDKTSLQAAILRERQVELFSEWGHRWFDLKRTGTIDAVMGSVSPQKGGVWNAYNALFPIPLSEINLDPNLVQNPGY